MSNIKKQIEKEYKIINLKYEYPQYIGKEKYAIISDLTVEELLKKYSDELRGYIPFVRLTVEQGEIICEFNRNEEKYRKRKSKKEDFFGYNGLTELRTQEMIVYDPITQDEADKYYKNREEEKTRLFIEAKQSLTEKQYKYLSMKYIEGKSPKLIAIEEGVTMQAINKHIRIAKRKFEKIFADFFQK